MKTFDEYLESKVLKRTVRNFSEIMNLIKSNSVTTKDLFVIAGYTYKLVKLNHYNFLQIVSSSSILWNDKIFEELMIDQEAVAYRLYTDKTRITDAFYPESSNVEDCLKLMAYCYAVHEKLIIKRPLEQSIGQFNLLYDSYLIFG